jgi:hypothetical protein
MSRVAGRKKGIETLLERIRPLHQYRPHLPQQKAQLYFDGLEQPHSDAFVLSAEQFYGLMQQIGIAVEGSDARRFGGWVVNHTLVRPSDGEPLLHRPDIVDLQKKQKREVKAYDDRAPVPRKQLRNYVLDQLADSSFSTHYDLYQHAKGATQADVLQKLLVGVRLPLSMVHAMVTQYDAQHALNDGPAPCEYGSPLFARPRDTKTPALMEVFRRRAGGDDLRIKSAALHSLYADPEAVWLALGLPAERLRVERVRLRPTTTEFGKVVGTPFVILHDEKYGEWVESLPKYVTAKLTMTSRPAPSLRSFADTPMFAALGDCEIDERLAIERPGNDDVSFAPWLKDDRYLPPLNPYDF